MAQLTKAAFLSKWLTLFADNVARAISELDMRDFREDVSDSFLTTEDNFQLVTSADTSGSTVTLALGSVSSGSPVVRHVHEGSAAIAANKTLAITGDDKYFQFNFESSGAYYIQCPASSKLLSYDGRRDGSNPLRFNLEAGFWRMEGNKVGSVWWIDLHGPYS